MTRGQEGHKSGARPLPGRWLGTQDEGLELEESGLSPKVAILLAERLAIYTLADLCQAPWRDGPGVHGLEGALWRLSGIGLKGVLQVLAIRERQAQASERMVADPRQAGRNLAESPL